MESAGDNSDDILDNLVSEVLLKLKNLELKILIKLAKILWWSLPVSGKST